mmetsp:Transcript_2918/g.8703  ORF Transcript_2918/g.8703 Transcript_2918/m.8703 type:complete len:210 (+) Transcript_2918:389-1018(+)
MHSPNQSVRRFEDTPFEHVPAPVSLKELAAVQIRAHHAVRDRAGPLASGARFRRPLLTAHGVVAHAGSVVVDLSKLIHGIIQHHLRLRVPEAAVAPEDGLDHLAAVMHKDEVVLLLSGAGLEQRLELVCVAEDVDGKDGPLRFREGRIARGVEHERDRVGHSEDRVRRSGRQLRKGLCHGIGADDQRGAVFEAARGRAGEEVLVVLDRS